MIYKVIFLFSFYVWERLKSVEPEDGSNEKIPEENWKI